VEGGYCGEFLKHVILNFFIHVFHDVSYVVVSKRIRQTRHGHKSPWSWKHEVTTTLTLNGGVKSLQGVQYRLHICQ
jgi:hypothetical protein